MKIFCCLLISAAFLWVTPVSAEEGAPRFQNQTLTIPRVDTDNNVGHYQNVQFKLNKDGRWDLQGRP